MAIISDIPGHSSPRDQSIENKKIISQQSAIKLSGQTSKPSLSSYIDGSRVVVDEYYKQYLLGDDLPRDYDNNASGVVQQYQLLKKLEIKITNVNESNQDSRTGIFGGTQTAVIPSGIRPYTGDIMIMSTLGKKRIMYRISKVERLTIIDDSSYQVEFEHMKIVDNQDLKALHKKVVHSSVYSKYRLDRGGSSTVNEHVYNSLAILELNLRPIVSEYLDTFLDRRSATLIMDKEGERIYDPFLTRFFLDISDQNDDRRIKDICHYGGRDWVRCAWAGSIYEALSERSKFKFKPQSSTTRTNDGRFPSAFEGNNDIYYQDISKVAFPVEKDLELDDYVIKGNLAADTYETPFEQACLNYINRSSLSISAIQEIIESTRSWSDKEKYYKIPVVIMLIKNQLIEDS